MIEAIVYIVICILTGVCGKESRVGFAGTFIAAVILTPLLVLPVLLLTCPSYRIERNPRRIWRI